MPNLFIIGSVAVLLFTGAWLVSTLRHRQFKTGSSVIARSDQAVNYWTCVAWLAAMTIGIAMLVADLVFGIDVRFWL